MVGIPDGLGLDKLSRFLNPGAGGQPTTPMPVLSSTGPQYAGFNSGAPPPSPAGPPLQATGAPPMPTPPMPPPGAGAPPGGGPLPQGANIQANVPGLQGPPPGPPQGLLSGVTPQALQTLGTQMQGGGPGGPTYAPAPQLQMPPGQRMNPMQFLRR